MKPSILYVYDYANEMLLLWNCTDIITYLKQLGHIVHICRVSDANFIQVASQYDIIIFYRTTVGYQYISKLKQMGKLLGYSIDDLTWKPNSYAYHQGLANIIELFLREVDVLVLPNQELSKYCPPKPIIYRKPAIPPNLLNLLSDMQESNSFVIAFTKSHVLPANIQMVNNTLELLSKQRVTFEFHYWSNDNWVKNYPHILCVRHKVCNNTKDFYLDLKNAKPHLLLSVLEEKIPFIDCKCYVKYLEAGALKVPLLTTRTAPYLEVIKEYYNGLFASDVYEMVEKISWALQHKHVLKKMGENAFLDITTNLTYEKRSSQFSKEITQFFEKNKNTLLQEKQQTRAEIINTQKIQEVKHSYSTKRETKTVQELTFPLRHNIICEQTQLNENLLELSGFQVYGTTYFRQILKDMFWEVIAQGTSIQGNFPAQHMVDNAWWTIQFDRQITIPQNSYIIFRFRNTDINPIAFYLSTEFSSNKAIGKVNNINLRKPIDIKYIVKDKT